MVVASYPQPKSATSLPVRSPTRRLIWRLRQPHAEPVDDGEIAVPGRRHSTGRDQSRLIGDSVPDLVACSSRVKQNVEKPKIMNISPMMAR